MAAFRKSLELGVDGIELDIHRCASGELVVIHDETLQRTTNGVGLVKDSTYDELKRLSAGKWFAPDFAAEHIPLLSEVLDLIGGQIVLNIEIKNTPIDYPGIEEELVEMLESYPGRDKIIVSSFEHTVMSRLHRLAPDINIALLAACRFLDLADYAAKMGARYYHPAFDCLLAPAIDEAHQAGLTVNAWTINNRAHWRTAAEWGIDGIVTDDPAGLKQYLSAVPKN
jgi:glycerophosphoryl diester phosphodiesterase